MIVVSNSSPLIALSRIHRLDLLRQVFGRVLIPPAVHQEVVLNCPNPKQKQHLEEAIGDYIDIAQTKMLKIFTRTLGQGEREVLSLALEISPDILMLDDKRARNEACDMGFAPSFTADILKEAEYMGLIPSYRAVLLELAGQKVFLPE